MPQDSHIPFYHTTIRRKLQEVFKIFLRKLCGVKFPSQCNSKCCCCGCLDNLRICLLADGSTCPRCPLRGGLPSLPPARPAFSLLCRPHPPAPSPPGKGEIFCFLMQGASPLASPRAEPGRHWLVERRRCPEGAGSLLCRSVGSRWASGIRVVKKPATPWGYLYGRDCKCRRRLNAGDARGSAPCMK